MKILEEVHATESSIPAPDTYAFFIAISINDDTVQQTELELIVIP